MKNKMQEKVLVVKAGDVFKNGQWEGINNQVVGHVLKLAKENGEFRKRGEVEEDRSWQQIIPYIIVCYKQNVFLMQRREDASEKRLAGLYSLGVGGHIRSEDLENGESFIDWSKRELEEELDYKGNFSFNTIGVLNDGSTGVGSVHLGIIILAVSDTQSITIRDEHKDGFFVSTSDFDKYYDRMESWSKIVFEYLKKTNNL